MRTWVGTVGFAVLGIVVGIMGILYEWNMAFAAITVILSAIFAYLMLPIDRSSKSAQQNSAKTAFIVGDASGSRLKDVLVEGADVFIGGNARNSVLTNVVFRARRAKRWFRRLWRG
jgi:hypothetical protein